MGNQKEGYSAVKEKVFQTGAQQLRETWNTERPVSLQYAEENSPPVAKTAKSSLLNTKPQNFSPKINGSSLTMTSDPYKSTERGSNSASLKIYQAGKRNMKNRVKYGMEVILDLYDCDPKVIRSAKLLKSFAVKMCKLLKMKRYGKALTPHFGHGDIKTSGYSLLQFLETSSITGHFSEEWNSAYINIFSCKMFSAKKAIDFTRRYFKAKSMVARRLARD